VKTHLDHPTQATACGKNLRSVDAKTFRASSNQCLACARTLAAIDAGRPAYSGLEPEVLRGSDFKRRR
jgi:hypothetical protein